MARNITVTAVITYPQRSDGRTTAVLKVTDTASRLPVVEVELDEADFMAMLRSSHQAQESPATVWPKAAAHLGKNCETQSEFFKGYGDEPTDEVEAWVASLGSDWSLRGIRRTNRGGWEAFAGRYVEIAPS